MFDAEEAVEVGVPRAALSAVGAVAVGDVDGRAALGERLQPVPGGGRELFARGDQRAVGDIDVGESGAGGGEFAQVGFGGAVGCREAEVATRTAAMPPCV